MAKRMFPEITNEKQYSINEDGKMGIHKKVE